SEAATGDGVFCCAVGFPYRRSGWAAAYA
ncbi:hypothetical protein A2U01_0095717, partial [Trifolium medium]|nr:hypothetical protein [Trifolium medium]